MEEAGSAEEVCFTDEVEEAGFVEGEVVVAEGAAMGDDHPSKIL